MEQVGATDDVKPKYKGLIVDYGVCAFKQAILAECIRQYESKK